MSPSKQIESLRAELFQNVQAQVSHNTKVQQLKDRQREIAKEIARLK